MLYTVQIRLDSGEMAARMSEMRQWLDKNGFEPEAFDYRRLDADGAVYRLDFKDAGEASTFAEAFAGVVVG
jgi:hypothetical protein